MLFFISGITGHVGGAAANQLLKDGHSIRALERDTEKAQPWADQGVEVVKGDWNDRGALAKAFQGIDGAYLMMSPSQTPSRDFREAKALVAGYKDALTQRPPPKLVLLSSFGSEQPSGLGLITATAIMEQQLGALDIPLAIVRPGGFFENFVGAIQPAVSTGMLYSFYQPLDRLILMAATADIGAQVALLLTTEWTGKRLLELGTLTSPDDIAAAMGQALGRKVTAQAIPRDRWSATLQSFGLPSEYTWAYEEMIDAVNSGHIHNKVPGTEHVPGTVTPTQFFTQHKPQA